MNPIPVILLGYLLLGLQVGAAAQLRVWGVEPNLVLAGVVFIASGATGPTGLIACFLLGLAQDALSDGQPFAHALSYTLAGWAVSRAARTFEETGAISQALLGALAAGVAATTMILLGLIRPSLATPTPMLLLQSIYSAAWVPLLTWPLSRLRAVFGFRRGRYLPGSIPGGRR